MAVITSKQIRVPLVGKAASDYAVGESVYLKENGSPVEYLVIHQGRPSSMYDASCNGTWLLRKDCSTNTEDYGGGSYAYANTTFFNELDSSVQSAVKQVILPYGEATGSSGLSAKVFYLSMYELGYATSNNAGIPVDGEVLDYFIEGTGTEANKRRIAYYNGTASIWWTRSVYTTYTTYYWAIRADGTYGTYVKTNPYGIRPAMILPSDAKFDPDTNIFKGVGSWL